MSYQIGDKLHVFGDFEVEPKSGRTIDLNQNPIMGAVIESGSTIPSGVEGQLWYRTGSTNPGLYYCTGTTNWVWLRELNLGNLPLHASTHKADQSDALLLHELGAPTADVSMNTKKITNLADPVDGTDAVNKNYADAIRSGLSIKDPVRAATAEALPTYVVSTNVLTASVVGVLTIDGVAVALGDRVLVKNAALDKNNGIYVVSTLGTASVKWVLTRATDANGMSGSLSEVRGGMATWVNEGAVNSDSRFVLITDDAIELNITSLIFSKDFQAADIGAGTGLTKSGSTLDVVAGNKSIKANANDIVVNLDTDIPSGLEITSTTNGGLKAKVDSTMAINANGIGLATAYKQKMNKVTIATVTTGTNTVAHGLAAGVTPDKVEFYTSTGSPIIFEITSRTTTNVVFNNNAAVQTFSNIVMICTIIG